MYFAPSQPVPATVPYELQGHISQDDWTVRAAAIKDLAFQYYKPLFERVWTVVAFISIIVLPLVLYQIILNSVFENGRQTEERFFEARAIGSAVFLGTILFFWLPMYLWKAIGKRRMRAMLSRWARADQATKGPSTFVPVWTVKCPTVFKSTAILSITTPPNTRPTVFHPDAYVPPFVNRPTDDGAPYYTPYNAGQQGISKMGGAGNLPMYSPTMADGKTFEDIKV